jgi:hypothetical protein
MEAASGVVAPPAEIPLTESERLELSRLRKKAKDQEDDISFPKRTASFRRVPALLTLLD